MSVPNGFSILHIYIKNLRTFSLKSLVSQAFFCYNRKA